MWSVYRAFSQNGHITTYQSIHSGESRCGCEVCNKAYSNKSSLINHKYIYSCECLYTCEVCNKVFNQQSILNIHQHMHIVEGAENWLVFSGDEWTRYSDKMSNHSLLYICIFLWYLQLCMSVCVCLCVCKF